jgi:anti-sigma-K factor RskA/sigma-70-like protein
MPTLDSLPADRRAIIELILRQGKSYDEISELLDLSSARVRDHARQSLAQLAPRTAERVDDSWRDQVADYLLGQQTGPEARATRGHLRTSEEARGWALSVLDSLGDLYAAGSEPEIPGANGSATAAPPAPPRPAAPAARTGGASLSPRAEQIVVRRRIVGAVAATVLIGLIAFVVGPGFSPGDDDTPVVADGDATPAADQVEPIPVGQLELRPEPGEKGEALATILDQGGQPGLLVQAAGLQPTGQDSAYEVWLYNDQEDAVSIGAQVTDEKGNYVGQGPMPTDFGNYEFVDISREPIDDDTGHSGDSVLRGKLAEVQAIPPELLAPQGGETPGGGSPPPP